MGKNYFVVVLLLCGFLTVFMYVVEMSKHKAYYQKHRALITQPAHQTNTNASSMDRKPAEKAPSITSPTPQFITPRSPAELLKQPWKILNDICGKHGCLTSKNISWRHVTFVKSTASNSVRRELIRRTWAGLSYVDGARFDTVFIVGRTDEISLNALLEEEHQRLGDILQYDGPDDYNQIGHKTLAGMAWASANLPSECFYSTADDDFMVNIGSLKEKIDENLKNAEKEKWPEFPILCGFVYGSAELPIRKENKKWSMPIATYKWNTYPAYCHGGLYTTSVSVIAQLYKESRLQEPWSVDDVWITGFLRNKLGMPSYMVLPLKPPPGIHYRGFTGKIRDSYRDYMQKEWNELYDTFKDKTDLCSC